MGTFKVPVGSVTKGGAWTTAFGSDLDTLNGLNGSNMTQTSVGQAICPPTTFANVPAPGSYSLDCAPASQIILDGTTPAGVGDLPAGFTVTFLAIKMIRLNYWSGTQLGGNNCISSFTMSYGPHLVLDNPSLTNGTHNNYAVWISPLPSRGELFTNHWSCQHVFTDANVAQTSCGPLPYAGAELIYFSFYLEGIYDIRNRVISMAFSNGRNLRYDDNSFNYSPPHWEPPSEY